LAKSDGGDQYTGLDRFGRVIDQNWFQTTLGGPVTLDRKQYGYDADSNRLFSNNLTNGGASFSELFAYDKLNRLTKFRETRKGDRPAKDRPAKGTSPIVERRPSCGRNRSMARLPR
jgi:hypothetical protein